MSHSLPHGETVPSLLDEEDGDCDEEDEEDEEDDDDVDPAFLDTQPRVVRLEGKGEAWRDRVDALAKELAG